MSRRRIMLAVLGAAFWTLAACTVADRMLRDEWVYSCDTDTSCEWEDEIRAKAEGRN